jgi:hypothetical protein
MRRVIFVVMAGVATLALTTAVSWAGNPHFVSCGPAVISGTCISVNGKEAGLGDEAQINIQLTATAECINPGQHHPKATNKSGVATDTDVPVQNGRANYFVSGCATFQPDCTPPMSVTFSKILLTDTTNNISCTP